MRKTIFKYDGFLFEGEESVNEYIVKKIGGKFNNIDVESTSDFADEWRENVAEKGHLVRAKKDYYHEEVQDAILPILNTLKILSQTTLDKAYMKGLVKSLEIAINRIGEKGFYGR